MTRINLADRVRLVNHAREQTATEIFAAVDLLISKYKLEPNYLIQHLEQDIAVLKRKYLEDKQ